LRSLTRFSGILVPQFAQKAAPEPGVPQLLHKIDIEGEIPVRD